MKCHHARNSNYNTYIQTFRVVIIYTQYRTEYLQMRSASGPPAWAGPADWPNQPAAVRVSAAPSRHLLRPAAAG